MEFDVVVVGGGPAGLATACRLGQLARENNRELSICVVEKGSEIGAHILSGAIFEPRALVELFPNWQDLAAPLNTPVSKDELRVLLGDKFSMKVPNLFAPHTMHNKGNYIISLGELCRWLAEQAEGLGVEIYPGFPAASILYEEQRVAGIITGDMGVDEEGKERSNYTPGMELRSAYTVFAEGSRGHLGKQIIAHYKLDADADPQHYAIGFKELWQVPEAQAQPGMVVHSAGWPLSASNTAGGGFLYHLKDNQVSTGLVVDLNYSNPYLNPFEEFQRFKLHPAIARHLSGGERVSYGARAITKGGPQSLPKMHFPGGLLVGCDAGTLNFAKIKGSHTAMKSGMLAAETIFTALQQERRGEDLAEYEEQIKNSWLWKELHGQRNFGPLQHRFGNVMGSAMAVLELNFLRGALPYTLHDLQPDHSKLKPASTSKMLEYPKPDAKLSFDLLSSVFLSNTNHEENQPCHLVLTDSTIPIDKNLPEYAEPAQRYCPAGVYEVIDADTEPRFQINAQNCIHCKTCDIKDPEQNITWCPPEGGGGPNYPNM